MFKTCAARLTVTTRPLGWSMRLPIAIQYKHHWHWALLQLECLSCAIFVMFRLWSHKDTNRSIYNLAKSEKAEAKSMTHLFLTRRYFMSVLISCPASLIPRPLFSAVLDRWMYCITSRLVPYIYMYMCVYVKSNPHPSTVLIVVL